MPLEDVTEEEVIIAVSQLKNGKSAGIVLNRYSISVPTCQWRIK